MVFRVYLAARIGAQGMGLYQLITTVYNLALTIATAGIGIAATRMITEEMALGGGQRLRSLCKKLLLASLVLGLLAAGLQLGRTWPPGCGFTMSGRPSPCASWP